MSSEIVFTTLIPVIGDISLRRITIENDLSYLNVFSNPPQSGTGTITGLVSVNDITIPDATAELFEEESRLHVQTTITDGLGRYTFDNLSTVHQYFVVIKEPTSDFDYLIRSRVVPV